MKLGRLGVWAAFDGVSAAAALEFARRIERWGYPALWMPEGRGRNVLVHAAFLLSGTSRLIVASGIANIYARDPMAMASAQRGLNEQSDGRFLLGIGVSHRPIVATMRGHAYGPPVATMRSLSRCHANRAIPGAASHRGTAHSGGGARPPHAGAFG
jgi:alkanesulfonate monooxygenase SsuD/methylene tetrahydromethanopterin reductase-like flavin-dependent oxidoreductase (luciferase family)